MPAVKRFIKEAGGLVDTTAIRSFAEVWEKKIQ